MTATENIDPSIKVTKLGTTKPFIWNSLIKFGLKEIDELNADIKKAKESGNKDFYPILLGLLRIEGDKKTFEEIAIDFAVEFGQSPPSWHEAHSRRKIDPKLTPIESNISSLNMDSIIEVTVKMESPKPLVLHLGNVRKYDQGGIELFLEGLNSRISRNEKTNIIGGDKFILDLIAKIKALPITETKSLWEFCFIYYRLNGLKKDFESAAVEYTKLSKENIQWHSLIDDASSTTEERSKNDLPLFEKLSEISKGTSISIIKSNDGKTAIRNKKINIDMVFVNEGSLSDIDGVNDFIDEFNSFGVDVSFINVNEVFVEMFKATAVDTKISTMIGL